ncbi:DUF7507 domain-containing protein, partial [Pedobacter xixiisoli]
YTVTDNNTGCATTVNYTITVNPLPTVAAIAGTGEVCVDGTRTLTNATTGGTWSSATPAVATISASGVVTGKTSGTSVISYTVTDNNTGCATTVNYTITVNAKPLAPTFVATNGLNSGTITVDIISGVTGYSIDGANFQTSNIFSNLAPGNYTITVKNASGCTNSAPATIRPAGTADSDLTPLNTAVKTNVLTNDGTSGAGATVTATDGTNGSTIVNIDGSVTYTPNPGFVGTDTYNYTITKNGITSNPITVTITVYSASVSLTKKAINTSTVTKVGDIINYTIEVSNTGTSALNNIVVKDAGADAGSISPANITTLAGGAKATVTAKHTLTQSEVDAGSFSNQASAKGKDPLGNDVEDEKSDDPETSTPNDPTVVTIISTPKIALVKTGIISSDGNTINYSFVIKNIGNVTLNSIILTDTKLSLNRTLTGISLAPGKDRTETATYTITQADKDAGKVTNSADVNAEDPSGTKTTDKSGTDGYNDTPTETIVPANPKITLVKTAVRNASQVVYTFTIKNTGNVTLTNIRLTDEKLGLNSQAVAVPIGGLLPGNTVTTTANYTLTQADVTNGTVSNTATIKGNTPSSTEISDKSGTTEANDSPTVLTLPAPPMANNDNTVTPPNTSINIAVLDNDTKGGSNLVPSTLVIVQQPQHGTLSIDPATGRVIYTPNANYQGTDSFTYTIKDANGFVSNIATVTIEVKDVPKIGLAKALISSIKTTNGSYDITYRFTVGNYGSAPFKNVSIKDDLRQTFSGTSFQVKKVRTLGTLNVNTAFNGTTDIELLQNGNSLGINQTQQIELVVNVSLMSITKTTYNNKATAEGESVTGLKTTDESTNGLKPDPNNDGNVSPAEPTPIDLEKPKEFIPGGFSPNGDGVNDVFVIENNGFKRLYLEVFNRWGNRVYRSNDYKNDWDGRCTEGISIGQQLPEGTYFYIVILDGKEKHVGNITLKR